MPAMPRTPRDRADAPHPTDLIVGANLQRCRQARGLGSEHLARQLGLSHQQVQRYESGAERISAARLAKIAALLDVPIAALFMPPDEAAQQNRDDALLDRPEALALVRAYFAIADSQLRQQLLRLVTLLAAPR
jgi:transcriptional regulator with XRE-family HTH domain